MTAPTPRGGAPTTFPDGDPDAGPAPAGRDAGDRPVRFGVFDWVDQRGDASLAQLYDERLGLVALAEDLGFAAYHLAEHHNTPLGMAPSPSVFLAAAAQATSRIRLGPLVYLLPLYEPLRLAEEICMLDALSGGRLELGVGRGVSPYELRYHGVEPERSRAMFYEALHLVLAALRGGRVSHDGAEVPSYRDVPIVARPTQQPYPPLWCATTNPETAAWAGREGLHLVGLGPAGAFRPVAEVWRAARTEAPDRPDRLNATVARPVVGLNRQIVVAETDAEALAVVRSAHPGWASSFIELWEANGDETFRARTVLEPALQAGTIVAGSPATVRQTLAAQVREAGLDYVCGAFAWGGTTPEQSATSMRLFAAEVMPAFATGPPGGR